MFRISKTLSLSALILLFSAFAHAQPAAAQKKKADETKASATEPAAAANKWAKKSVAKIEKFLGVKDLSAMEVVLIGDSTFGNWQKVNKSSWKEVMSEQPFRSFNMGVTGDRTENVLYRLQPASEGGLGHLDDDQLQPRSIVLMIGSNNLLTHDVSETVAGISAVCDQLRELRPDAKIILCSILPTAKEETNKELVVPVNEAISTLENVHWLDLYPLFTDEKGTRQSKLFGREIAPNKAGYQILEDQLLPLFN